MKKQVVFVLVAACSLFTSCGMVGGSSDPEKGYIEECNKGNFQAAREIVEGAGPNSSICSEGIAYINDKEINKLLANMDKDNANRILFLYNSYESTMLPDMNKVAEVAISGGDSYLVDCLLRAGLKADENIVIAAVNQEMVDVVSLCLKGNPTLIYDSEVKEFVLEFIGESEYKSFQTKAEKEMKKVVRERIQQLSSIEIPKRPALGLQQSNHYGELDESYEKYNDAVVKLNSECIKLLAEVVETKDMSSAKKIIAKMRPTLSWQNLGDWETVVVKSDCSSVYNAFEIKEDRTDIEQAEKMLSAAMDDSTDVAEKVNEGVEESFEDFEVMF